MSNTFKFIFSVLVGILSLSGAAKAATISPLIVGATDTYLGSCIGGTPSSVQDEIDCFATLGITVTGAEMEKDEALSFDTVDGETDVYAHILPTGYQGGYFLIKTGNLEGGQDGNQYFFIFLNNANTEYAVIDFATIPFDIDNIDKFSHITGTSLIATPLPAAVWMFVTALGGLFGIRKFSLRRRKIATA